jgi:hypothetical protein
MATAALHDRGTEVTETTHGSLRDVAGGPRSTVSVAPGRAIATNKANLRRSERELNAVRAKG